MKSWKRFERSVAAQIVATFADLGIGNKDCYRTPMSGGHRYARKNDPGDVVISSRLRKYFPFHVECKCYATVDLSQFLVPMRLWKKSWYATKWLKQMEDAAVDGMIPLLIFKEDKGETLAAAPVQLGLGFVNRLNFVYQGREWNVVRFSTFLRKVRVRNDSQGGVFWLRDRK